MLTPVSLGGTRIRALAHGHEDTAARRPRFSLVLATVGRTNEVERFLLSLDRQEDAVFELIVVDQNIDDRLVPLLEQRRNRHPIRHVREKRRGASHARNVGLRHVTGDLIAFPDDDCWYPDRLLNSISQLMAENPFWDGVTCLLRDASGTMSNGRFDSKEGAVSLLGAWAQATECTMFFRRSVIDTVGEFDEELGVGSGTAFGSGEGTDYLLRAIHCGFRIYYRPSVYVCHPQFSSCYDGCTIRKARSYGAGMGRVLRKHRYPLWFKLRMLARPLGGALVSLATFRARKSHYYLSVFLGRLHGLLAALPAERRWPAPSASGSLLNDVASPSGPEAR